MAAPKTLWITSVQPETIGGRAFVPTALRYQDGGRVAIGHDAVGGEASVGFKLALGDIRPGQSPDTRDTFHCSDGARRSAYELAQDFLNQLLASVEDKLPPRDHIGSVSARLVVAEPLKFQLKTERTDWLNNYRQNVARILGRFQTIEFLPEPFAVYQYYKYGLRLPKLAERTKRFALILDMGGGTFDVCIIESTTEGDVSRTGSHSKPLAAKSAPFAGFHLDRQIALYLLKRNVPDVRKKDVERYYEQYERTLRGDLDRRDLRAEAQAFMANMDRLRPLCEEKKIELTTAIADWRLGVEQYDRVEVDVPVDPLGESTWAPSELYGHQMFTIFEKTWNTRLKSVVKGVMVAARDRLEGNGIDVSLISGGSANIGWLAALLRRDFEVELAEAEPVNIGGSYQNVVANGLAIECARRHFSEKSDAPEFVAVTYNPIRLLLAADGGDLAKLRFRSSDDKVDMQRAQLGDLLPSAHAFRHFFGHPLRWRVKLPNPPRRQLDYLFCRPSDSDSQSEEALDLAYNLEERTLHTSVKKFDAQMTVEVTVHEDGTVKPKFIYKLANERGGVAENSEQARPFYIDMTTDATEVPAASYVGLDFGTSNSSICLLPRGAVELVHERSMSDRWRSLNEALAEIPFPAAVAVRRFLAAHDTSSLFSVAIEAYEACLAMLAYSMAADVLYEKSSWRGLRNLQHRSLGPLKALLDASLRQRAERGCVADPTCVASMKFVDDAIQDFTDGKHHQASQVSPKWVDYVGEIARVTARALSRNLFGYCATSDKVPYEERFEGTFKVAHDQPPFVRHHRYSSPKAIDPTVALIVDRVRGKARSLTPLLVWHQERSVDEPVCYVLDVIGRRQYKPCHTADKVAASDISPSLPKALQVLLDEGRFVTGEIDFEFVGAGGEGEGG